jgi:putative oxidoreductase
MSPAISPPSRVAVAASWATAGLLALAFAFAGGFKLTGNPEPAANFAAWGYPDGFVVVVGVVEVLTAALLLVPRTRLIGAVLGVCTMLGAVVTHIRADQFAYLPPPIALLLLASACAFLSWRNRRAS